MQRKTSNVNEEPTPEAQRKGSNKANEESTQEMERKASKVSKKSIENIERKESIKVARSASSRIAMNRKKMTQKKQPVKRKSPAVSCGVHLDSSIGVSAESRFKRKHYNLIQKLSQDLALTYNEIESLLLIYHKLQLQGHHGPDGMTATQFVDVLHTGFNMTDDRLNQYVAMVLQVAHSSLFCMDSWVRAMALFLKGTFEEKMKHCYGIYDWSKKDQLKKDHLLHLLEDCFVGEDSPEEITYDLVEMALKKLDVDDSGVISYENYRAAVIKEPLLMESFGQCLPDRLSVQSFLTTFTPNRQRF